VVDKFPQQRRFARIATEHAVMVTKVGAESLEEFARTQEMSLGGCMFQSDEAIGQDSVVEVMISLAGRVVSTTARVAYENPHGQRFEVGVEFLRLDADDRQFLRAFLEAEPGDA
jgi:PilZ domain